MSRNRSCRDPSRTCPRPAKVTTVALLNEEHTTVSESGKLTTTTRSAVRMLTRQGASAIFSEQYDTASGKVRDFKAWTISPSGKVKKYGKDEILDVGCAENDVYNHAGAGLYPIEAMSRSGRSSAMKLRWRARSSAISYASHSSNRRRRSSWHVTPLRCPGLGAEIDAVQRCARGSVFGRVLHMADGESARSGTGALVPEHSEPGPVDRREPCRRRRTAHRILAAGGARPHKVGTTVRPSRMMPSPRKPKRW